VQCCVSTIDPTPPSERDGLVLSAFDACVASRSLGQGVSGSAYFYIHSIDLLSIFSDDKYMNTILILNFTSMPSFNFECFVVSEQRPGEKYASSPTQCQ